MAENTSGLILDPRLMEPELTENEKALRDVFVDYYSEDFDAYQACIKVGFQSAFATEFAKKFMAEPYVLRRISEQQRSRTVTSEKEVEDDRALIISTLRQASQNGPYASRVAAARELAKMRGFTNEEGTEDKDQQLIDLFRNFAQKAPL